MTDRRQRTGILMAAALTASVMTPFAAFAKEEEDRTPVGRVELEIDSSIDVGDVGSEIDVTLLSGDCEIDTVDVINEPTDEWKHKNRPKLEITLSADQDYYFKSGYKKKMISLSGSTGTVSSVKRNGEEELRVVVTLKALKGTDSDYELDVDEAQWGATDGEAFWADAEDARYYELRVYRDGKFLTTAHSVRETSCNLGKYFDAAGEYWFEVRAVYGVSRKGEWQTSETLGVTAEQAAEIRLASSYRLTEGGPDSGMWEQDAFGYRYCNGDGTYTRNNWQRIQGLWYFFDENGYRKTGWLSWNDKLYFLDENGVMLTNSQTPDGKWAGEDGSVA